MPIPNARCAPADCSASQGWYRRPIARLASETVSTVDNGGMEDAVRAYIDAIDPQHRPLFERLHNIVVDAHPDAAITMSYQMPTYALGDRRVYLAAWRHGVSIYGWDRGRDGGSSNGIRRCCPAGARFGCARRTRQ